MTLSRICIYGAGAIGGWIGARLAQRPGVVLSVVARGETLIQLESNGLQLHSGDQTQIAKVHASAQPAALGVQDLVIIAVKAPSMLEVAKQIQPLIGPNTIVMTAMNGVPWWFLQGFGASMPTHH
jgi:2-dehydropantoate 2-reductase